MQLTKEAEETIKEAPKDWIHDEAAQAENEKYLKNIEMLREIDQLKYRYDVLEGEIMAIEFKKQMLPSKLKSHVMIFILFVIMAYMMAKSLFSIFFVPFYIIGLIAELIKVIKDFLPHIANLPALRRFCLSGEKKPYDLLIDEKKIEQRGIKSRIAELDAKVEKMSLRGEDMIS